MGKDKLKVEIAETLNELASALETGRFGASPKIALIGQGSEHGEENALKGALEAAKKGIEVYYIGSIDVPEGCGVTKVEATDAEDGFKKMEQLLDDKVVQGAVAMHYPFPIGVSTVGRSIAPSRGTKFFLATTTGTTSTDLVEGLVFNAINGIATAKACGIARPKVGILNLNGARQAEIVLKELKEQGYDFDFAETSRADGGAIMRGNDVLLGSADVMVCDTLTGNVLSKVLTAYTSGGSFEAVGDGYGPGIGQHYDRLIMIVSRASGYPVIANAIAYAAELVQGKIMEKVAKEYDAAEKAGLTSILESKKAPKASTEAAAVEAPPHEVCDEQIPGVDVMDLDDAVQAIWQAGIYAESGMGCTGPVIRMNVAKKEAAHKILVEKGYIAD